MDKSIGILGKAYMLWVKELVNRYRSSQVKAAVKVNNEMIRFYWELGKDIEEKQVDNKYGSKFYATLSRDLRHELPNVEGLSETSIRYAIDKCSDNSDKALFYVRQTLENGWSR